MEERSRLICVFCIDVMPFGMQTLLNYNDCINSDREESYSNELRRMAL